MPLSSNELDRLSDSIVASALTCRVHTASPGANGVANRLGSLVQSLPAATWSSASNGDVQYNADINFGVVDSSQARTITHISLWRSTTFVASAQLSAAVQVGAGSTFRIVSGTLRINGSTA